MCHICSLHTRMYTILFTHILLQYCSTFLTYLHVPCTHHTPVLYFPHMPVLCTRHLLSVTYCTPHPPVPYTFKRMCHILYSLHVRIACFTFLTCPTLPVLCTPHMPLPCSPHMPVPCTPHIQNMCHVLLTCLCRAFITCLNPS